MMNPVVAAAHGKVAATVVHLLGDPTLDWAAFAEFAKAKDQPELAALGDALASFNTWAGANLSTAAVEAHGRIDTEKSTSGSAPSSEGPESASAQVKAEKSRGWCVASQTVATDTPTGGRMACPACGRDVGVSVASRIISRHKVPARGRT